ncbi:MAG: septum formation initiator family protein [Cytophagaceae bacterium]|jgi:cell division protein FtsB|nr:septum formation initiator family protein [Cytophagaceae bacterium]
MRWKAFIQSLPSWLKNFYFITGVLFIVHLTFFDVNNLINQYKLSQQLNDLENEKAYYLQKIVQIQQEQEALTKDKEKLERFAREHYLMKKPQEDIYIIRSNE